MSLSCNAFDELLPAFVVDALTPEERLAVLEHLADCREHDVDLDDMRESAATLPTLVEAMAPPARLRNSLLGSFEAAVSGGRDEVPVALAPYRPAIGRARQLVFAYALAAVLAVVAIGLGAWNLSLSRNGDELVVRTASAGTQSMEVVYVPSEGVAVMRVQLSAPPTGQVYQAWQVNAAGAQSLGLLPANGTAAFSVDLSGATAVAISVEPAGGSIAPTTTPILVAEL